MVKKIIHFHELPIRDYEDNELYSLRINDNNYKKIWQNTWLILYYDLVIVVFRVKCTLSIIMIMLP